MKNKLPFLLQGLFVVFLWSASKIVMKIGLEEIPPYFFAGMIQLLVFIILLIYTWRQGKKYFFGISFKHKYLMILSGVVGYGAATLFVMIGLQYVTGATAGLAAATSIIFNLLMAGILVREKLRMEQYLGIAVLLVGIIVFLGNQVLGGTLLGVGLLLLAEAGYAFNNAVARMISKAHKKDITLTLALIGNGVGAMILVPIGLLAGGLPQQIVWDSRLIIGVITVALIFAFGGLLWNGVLDKLRVIEASVLTNTIIIQVAILSVIFLHETLTSNNILGGLLVLLGAVVVDGRMIFPRAFGLRLVG